MPCSGACRASPARGLLVQATAAMRRILAACGKPEVHRAGDVLLRFKIASHGHAPQVSIEAKR
eukprot:10920816-Alexandrium_andersonii.AAC.1